MTEQTEFALAVIGSIIFWAIYYGLIIALSL